MRAGPRWLGTALALAVAAGPAAAQGAVLRGRVLERETGTPLADAEVAIRGAGRQVRTDAAGDFELRRLPAGRLVVEVRRVGFAPATLDVALAARETRQVDVRLDPAPVQLDPVVTSATRDARSLAAVSAAMAVADSVAIRSGRTAGLHEALRVMPGVQASARTGTDDVSLSIRGSGARVRQAVRGIGVLLDGVPLTEADGIARLDLVELAVARQVEVVRGPASALYAGASGGVVNVLSRTGAEHPGVALRAQRGGWSFAKVDGSLGVRLAGLRGGVLASGAYTSADGYRAHADARTFKAGFLLDAAPAPRTRLAVELSGATLDSRLPGGLTQAEFDADPFAASDSAVKYGFGRTDERYRAGVRVSQGLFAAGNVSAYAYYGGRRFDFPITGQAVDANFHRVQYGARLSSGFADGSPLEVTLGFDHDRFYGDDRRLNNRPPQPDTLVAQGYLSTPNTGLYAQAAWRASAAVDVTAGVRYDEVSYRSEDVRGDTPTRRRTDGQLSPKLTATWRPGTRSTLFATVARGFEVLSFAEVQNTPGQPFNLAQRPKSLWNYEVGGRTTVRDRLLLDGAVFYQDVRNEFVPRSLGGEQLFDRASRSRGIGVELGATALVATWLDLSAAYTFSDFRFRDFTTVVTGASGQREEQDYAGNRLPGVPAHRVAGEVRLRPWRTLSGAVQLEWQDRVFVDNANSAEGVVFAPVPGGAVGIPFRAVPARMLVHLNATWQVGGASVFGSVENLLGTRYAGTLLVNDAQGRFFEAGPGAWLTLGVSVALWRGGFRRPALAAT